MTYEIAEYKYATHMKSVYGLVGDIEYPSRKHSQQDSEGNWILVSYNGHKMGKVLTNGKVIA
jgi:hypothetical protein